MLRAPVRMLWMLAILAVSAGAGFAFPGSNLPSNNSLVLADLNGDKRTDAIRVRLEESSAAGLIYALDVKMSGSQTGSTNRVLVQRWGIDIIPRDVDGDHDLDLVVENLATHEALQVLVNDGTGVFAEVDAALYPGALWQETGTIATENSRSSDAGIDEDSGRDDLAVVLTPAIATTLLGEAFGRLAIRQVLTGSAIPGRSRAPPRS